MMKSMRETFEQDEANNLSLQNVLDLAKYQAVHRGDLSSEEAFEIGECIKRDINDAAEYMMETSTEFYDWLMLDIDTIERKVIKLFLTVADYTRLELELFRQKQPKNKSF